MNMRVLLSLRMSVPVAIDHPRLLLLEFHQRADALLGSTSILAHQSLGLTVASTAMQPAGVEHDQADDTSDAASNDQGHLGVQPETLVESTVAEHPCHGSNHQTQQATQCELPEDPMTVAAQVRTLWLVLVRAERAGPHLVVPGLGVESHVVPYLAGAGAGGLGARRLASRIGRLASVGM